MVKNTIVVAILISCLLFLGYSMGNGIVKTVNMVKTCYSDIDIGKTLEAWRDRNK